MKKGNFKLTLIFSSLVFLILFLTMTVMAAAMMFLYRDGFINNPNPDFIICGFAISSIVVGTFLSRFVGKKTMLSIVEISEATKEVAKGNFEIRMDEEKNRVWEIREMAHNFNIMTSELAGTELFRNDFINNVSHEFKTPLSAIEGYATLLQNKGLSEEKRDAYITRILANTKRLSNLSGNILQLSRLEHQNITVSKTRFSLDEQIRQMVLFFTEQWTKKQLQLDIDLEPIDFYGNEELMAQVWQNLIGNAMKFVSENGLITVHMSRKDRQAVIQVCDDGCGMDLKTAARIFEKFYQGDSSHTSEGNGLGLTLAKKIIDLHEGKISVSSREGKGTTFTVVLPLLQE